MSRQSRSQTSFLGALGALALAACSGVIDKKADSPEGDPLGNGGAGMMGSTASNPTNQPGGGTPGSSTSPGGSAMGGTTLPPPEVTPPAACQTPAAAPSPLRRLTRAEYLNTLRDLLGKADVPAVVMAPDTLEMGLDNIASVQSVSQLLAEQYETAAATVAAEAVRTLPALLKCDVAAMGEDACARRFIADFGLRAFRRPVTQPEATRLFALFSGVKPKQGFAGAIEALVQGILMSPQLLYRIEMGASPAGGGGLFTKLTSYEMATRLSYFIWGSMPDTGLFAAAAANQLETPAQVSAQAIRMLDDPRARAAVGRFYEQWLKLGGLENIGKDTKVYGAFKASLTDLWGRESAAFIEDVIFKGDAKVKTLLTADYTFANKTLAEFYRYTGPMTEENFERIKHGGNRLGFLTQGAFLAKFSHADQTSPVKRGQFVIEQLLCVDVPPPPPDANPTPPVVKMGQSTRERFAAHATAAECASCHRLMDPIGLALENFDGIGRYRTVDQGVPVDARGQIYASDVDGPVNGALELARRLGGSEQLGACAVTNWFRYAHGREEAKEDTCALDTLKEQMKATGGDLKRLVVALTQTQVFLNKTGGTP